MTRLQSVLLLVFSATVASTATVNAAISDGLLVHWKLDTGTGATAIDETSYNNDGAINNGNWTDGHLGNALDFNGSNTTATDLDADNYLNGLTAITIAMWVKSNVTGQDRGLVFTRSPTTHDEEIGIRYDASGASSGATSNIKASLRTDAGYVQVETGSDVQSTEWQHVTMTWESGDSLLVYIDGTRAALVYSNVPTLSGAIVGCDRLLVGLGTKNRHWDGLIDDFRIYDRRLDDAEIEELANMQDSPVVVQFRFEENTGQFTFDSIEGIAGRLGTTASADAADPAWGAGRCGHGLHYDGVDDFVYANTEDHVDLTSFSIGFWIFPQRDSGMEFPITCRGPATQNLKFIFFRNGPVFYAYFRGITIQYVTFTVPDNRWSHIAATVDVDNGVRVFLDGVFVGSRSYPGYESYNSVLYFGSFPNLYRPTSLLYPFQGVLDEFVVYNTAVDDSEIPAMMTCPEGPSKMAVIRWRETRN